MPRFARMVIPEEKAIYHVMSRTALDGFPFQDAEKDQFVKILKRFSVVYFAEVLGYCIMGNHFHILVKMYPHEDFSDEEIIARYEKLCGNDAVFPDGDDREEMILY